MRAADGLRLAGLLASACALGACVTWRVEESKNAATGIKPGESIVILARSYHQGNDTETGFLSCIVSQMQKGRDGLAVRPEHEFRDALFPWFEPRTMPQGVDALPELLARPGVSERIDETGIRYIVWVNGSTERTSDGGSLSCAAGPGGGGCFGLAWWEDDASYEASIWDLKRSIAAGEVSTDVHGTSMIPAIVIPLPLIARTQSAACKSLARELRAFIVADKTT